MLYGNLGTPINKITSLWNFVPNSGVEKLRHGKSVVLADNVNGRAC